MLESGKKQACNDAGRKVGPIDLRPLLLVCRTSFLMRLREPMDAPNWDEFGRFLAMTLLFTVHLKTVRVRMNGVLVLELRKKISPPTSIAFDRRTIRSMSPQRIFELTEVEACHVQMDVRKLVVEQSIVKSIFHFFASAVTSSSDAAGSSNAASGDAATYTTANIFMRMLTGTARASPPTKFAREMERTTKKPPPSVVKLRMVYTSRDEHASSVELCRDSPVLRDLVPFPAQGKVFIGFPTHQVGG